MPEKFADPNVSCSRAAMNHLEKFVVFNLKPHEYILLQQNFQSELKIIRLTQRPPVTDTLIWLIPQENSEVLYVR